jgi:carbon-monoxide dehydrogenase small subunit
MSAHHVTVTVNGEQRRAEVEARKLLVHLLREEFGVTSAHVGCDTSQCGACTVRLDGRAVKSCTVLAVQADGAAVDTIESLSTAGDAEHPLLSAFRGHHALQCGFCTPGMVMSSLELLQRERHLSEERVRAWLKGNFCRCTGYQNIVDAVLATDGVPAAHEAGRPLLPRHCGKQRGMGMRREAALAQKQTSPRSRTVRGSSAGPYSGVRTATT